MQLVGALCPPRQSRRLRRALLVARTETVGRRSRGAIRAALESRLLWLAIIGVVTTVISFYYYLYVIVQMYMREPNEEFQDVTMAGGVKLALFVSLSLVANSFATTQNSANYTDQSLSVNAGGLRSATTSYINDAALGEITGQATAPGRDQRKIKSAFYIDSNSVAKIHGD